jgi:subtilisin family serine protease
MRFGRTIRVLIGAGSLVVGLFASVPPAAAAQNEDNYIVIYGSNSQVNQGEVRATGAKVTAELGDAGLLGVRTNRPDSLTLLPGVVGVAKERMRFQVPQETVVPFSEDKSGSGGGCASTDASCPLQWDLARIHVSQAWETTKGSSKVKVAVIDTGLTSSHQEVGANYDKAESASFVQPSTFCAADATTFSSIEDFNGHGTWTNTHVAGVNGAFMTGIAPGATLVNIRVLGACGFGFDSWVMNGMLYGNKIGAQVESMSLGGFLCGHGVVAGSVYCGNAASVGTDPLLWKAYKQLVSYMLKHGTVVVAAAGNDHAQLDASGQVVSHGTLADVTVGPDPLNDFFGLTEAPGGVPGVVAVAALNRVTAGGTAADSLYGQYGVGRKDQLSYFSNYGQRIDVSAPGGARNFNLPRFDCITAICGRAGTSSPTATDNPEDFGAWGVDGSGNPCSNCYIFVQGTSMATPQVAGVAALALSANPELSPKELVGLLRRSVSEFSNPDATPPIEDNASMPTWNFSIDYDEAGVRNRLMGTGVIDAARAVGQNDHQGGGGGGGG